MEHQLKAVEMLSMVKYQSLIGMEHVNEDKSLSSPTGKVSIPHRYGTQKST